MQPALRHTGPLTQPAPRVAALRWGTPSELVGTEVVVATDVFYTREAVRALAATLLDLAPEEVWLAAGRNRAAASDFFELAAADWVVYHVPEGELHRLYHCEDVQAWRLRRRRGSKRSVMQRERDLLATVVPPPL